MNKIKITKEFGDEVIDNILKECFGGGSNYWIDKISIILRNYNATEYSFDSLSNKGIKLRITIKDSEEKYILTKKKMLKGIKRYYKKSGAPVDFEYMDNRDCDLILQYALFKTMLYN